MNISHLKTGFTLIELMITIAIIAIIATIAIPSYRDSVRRSNRTEAMTALMNVAANQESFYLQNNIYSDDASELGFAANPGITEHGYYLVAIVADPTLVQGFNATATKAGAQSDDTDCAEFTIDHDGIRTAENSGGTDNTDECWR
ncbi:MAG: prepilin-type N-terminal cleavage/methylation domain-containing protein [Gammaproteobacteria bacterium]|nr:prepilin-type N-terminal cleavage/methylation domain-containing protein [Gammaproteobacteria bacterium]